ncbi:MAG: metal ABC transporter permease [Limisphaerales bacterium]|nr:ABC transporter [Pedosphaera sp.]MEC7905121.1 metal ABC transporter permease [Verrucomicrobiota bacterium]HBF02690.1 ABC transporter [Verrucomicrobiales bacterium]MAN30174.1 ABC transporter [Pedosphaera sp.]HCB96710.1 ABC transporter [Verrucomicrobiales bacterium]|tara:strand:+ start:382 stop:1422 length:1041 start_codon:yes stop_codon:yes gene_type:complete
MNTLILPWDWHRVVIEPWSSGASVYGWILLMGFLINLTCGLIGNYLILRRMALIGDAISHSVLPGMAIAFLVAGAWQLPIATEGTPSPVPEGLPHGMAMVIGAGIAGIVTSLIIEWIHQKSRIKQDAAIGITFSTLFALGVVIISLYADKVDLDADCVLHGEIAFIPLEPFLTIGTHPIAPAPVVQMGVVAILTALGIGLFYKELLVSSFDPGLAHATGIRADWIHYGLMIWLSVVVVSAFESVGAILVIAMLILPGASASLLSQRLHIMLAWSSLHALLSSLIGLHLAIWWDTSIAGSMVVAGSGLFFLSWLISPSQGPLWRRLRRKPSTDTKAAATQPLSKTYS